MGRGVLGERTLGLLLGALALACIPPPPAPTQRPAEPRALTPEPSTEEKVMVASTSVEWTFPDGVRAGALYASVEGQGVLRLGRRGFEVVLATQAAPVALVATPSAGVLSSFHEYGTARIYGDTATHLSKRPYSQVAFLAEDDAWGTPDRFAWEIHHFDGSRWSAVTGREAFKGRFDDNKLNAIAVTEHGVWVSSWNGLFLREQAKWVRVQPPKAVTSGGPPHQLSVYEDRLIASYDAGQFMRVGESWAKLAWPSRVPIEAISQSGLAVGRSGTTLFIGKLGADQARTATDIARVGFVSDVDVDEAGRIWLVGEHSLLALDSSGQVIVEYGPGTIPGLNGHIELLAVSGGGPKSLPPPKAPAKRTVRGRVQIYKSGQALVGARVELCSSITGCADAPWKRQTRTDARGSFQFRGVPAAHYYIHVTPPHIPECESPFTVTAPSDLAMAQACPPGMTKHCEAAPITACLPFEMPPR